MADVGRALGRRAAPAGTVLLRPAQRQAALRSGRRPAGGQRALAEPVAAEAVPAEAVAAEAGLGHAGLGHAARREAALAGTGLARRVQLALRAGSAHGVRTLVLLVRGQPGRLVVGARQARRRALATDVGSVGPGQHAPAEVLAGWPPGPMFPEPSAPVPLPRTPLSLGPGPPSPGLIEPAELAMAELPAMGLPEPWPTGSFADGAEPPGGLTRE